MTYVLFIKKLTWIICRMVQSSALRKLEQNEHFGKISNKLHPPKETETGSYLRIISTSDPTEKNIWSCRGSYYSNA